jgi:cytochrome c peroxidase
VGGTDPEAVRRGREVFAGQACGNCHAPPAFTSAGTYNVGLSDEAGNTHFNPPSLRGVGQGGPYFHDNSAATLEEVFVRARHQLRGELSKRELADLLAFLRSL